MLMLVGWHAQLLWACQLSTVTTKMKTSQTKQKPTNKTISSFNKNISFLSPILSSLELSHYINKITEKFSSQEAEAVKIR